MELSVERDGRIVLYAPKSTDPAKLKGLVHDKLLWIHRQLGRKGEELHQLPEKEFVSGEGFYYRGRKYRLMLFDDLPTGTSDQALSFQNGRFFMLRHLAPKGRDLFVEWYTRQAMKWIPGRVRQLQSRVGTEPESIGIRDLGFRWGSCTQKGKLFFHWRLILLPSERIDYLILHELVHLHEHNHSPAFYERLKRAVPGYERHIEWLRRNGDQYSL